MKLFRNISAALLFLFLAVPFLAHACPDKFWLAKNTANNPYMLSLRSFADFKEMQGAPLSDKFNDVLSVKVVFDVRENVLYFINSSQFKYHVEFCHFVLGDDLPLNLFNSLNYGISRERRYYLANLNYYVESNQYGLEFSSEDRINATQIWSLFKTIQQNSYLGDSLQLLVSSEYLIKMDKEHKLYLRKIYTTDIYKNQKFQLLNAGSAYGVLRMNDDEHSDNKDEDILIIKGTPPNVPVCAGIITNSYQTPLSHINILCHNRDIPSAVDIDILNDTAILANLNKPVRLDVTPNGIIVTPVEKKFLDSMHQLHKTQNIVLLKYDTSVQKLLPVKDFGLKQKDIVGNKAAGVGELNKIAHKLSSSFLIPEGAFAIPFYYYHMHVSRPAISARITELQQMQKAHAPADAIKKQLKLVRQAIKDEPADPQLVKDVTAMIKANGAWRSYRFRSSANAEDVAGFSAAGLYESKTGSLDDKEKPIDMAIKKVWASSYSDAAFLERTACNIDESTVMMGILCHRNFPDEKVNGVAITKNIYRPGFPGFTVNVQKDEVPVVSPPDSVTCEQFICMNAVYIDQMNNDIVVDYITYSNINGGKPVLNKQEIQQLYNALSEVRSYYYNNVPGPKPADIFNLGLDIEFKFERNGKLYLKQVRPYR